MASPNLDTSDGLPKVEAASAREILEQYDASEAALELDAEGTTPSAFLDSLFRARLFEDAITFLAYALPKREAVWWGLSCARDATPSDAPPEQFEALTSVESWLEAPDDERRREAFTFAEKATYGAPAGCIALAAFFSEGSLAPADCPPVPVGEEFCARTVAAAVLLSSLQVSPDESPALAKDYAERGIETARCVAPWDEQ